jgi:plastocyanin
MRSHAIRIGVVVAVASTALWGGSGMASAGGGGGGCVHAAGPTTGRGDSVDLKDICFSATVLYVDEGTDVTWTNRDPVTHNVVGVGGTWGDPGLTLFQGDDVNYLFEEDGVFPYACLIHPGMIGAIVVGDGVGTDLAGVVPGTATEGSGDPATTEVGSASVAQENGVGPIVVWVVGAALLLAGLAGAFAIAARSRRKGTVVAG